MVDDVEMQNTPACLRLKLRQLRASFPRVRPLSIDPPRMRGLHRIELIRGLAMILMVEDREAVISGFVGRFQCEGVPVTGLSTDEFLEWIEASTSRELQALEAFLIGNSTRLPALIASIKRRSRSPIIALIEVPSLDWTLQLFGAGVDDVARKPIHPREIMARINAIGSRQSRDLSGASGADMEVYFDGREPRAAGCPLMLPRRERRILEFLVRNKGRRVTRGQIFSAIYGIFDENVEETVVESHISKLRKKLRDVLGYDPIDSRRYLGYMFDPSATDLVTASGGVRDSQAVADSSTDWQASSFEILGVGA